jgi:hypothetical protein
MTANPLRGEATAQLGDRTLTLVLDNERWWQIEELLDTSMYDIRARLHLDAAAQRSPKNHTASALLWGATREHHGDLTMVDCGNLLITNPKLHDALFQAVLDSTTSQEPAEPGEAKPAKEPANRKRKSAES